MPWLLTGLYAGALVDRVDRAALVRNVQLDRLIIAAALGALVLAHRASMPVVYAAAFLIGAGEVLVESALQSLVPRVATRHDLERANSRLIAAETAGNELVGPPVGALLFTLLPAAPFLIDAASYGASATAVQRLTSRLPSERCQRVPLRRIIGEVIGGLRWLRAHSYLRAITVWGGVFNIGSTAAYSLLVLFASTSWASANSDTACCSALLPSVAWSAPPRRRRWPAVSAAAEPSSSAPQDPASRPVSSA